MTCRRCQLTVLAVFIPRGGHLAATGQLLYCPSARVPNFGSRAAEKPSTLVCRVVLQNAQNESKPLEVWKPIRQPPEQGVRSDRSTADCETRRLGARTN